jgi:release factor glutamine methyltransferase
LNEHFDLILCNPPYVEGVAVLMPEVADWEPRRALYAGDDGMDAYRWLAPELGKLLAPGGIVCLEIGTGQEEMVSALFAAQGFTIESRRDLRGIVRCLVLTLERL